MILGLSHVGLTVSELDQSVRYYQDRFHFPVLSDAERKGKSAERITGIPGIHTRNVYLSVTPQQHLEVFGFYHPPVLPPAREKEFRVEISYVAFMKDELARLADSPGAEQQGWVETLRPFEETPYQGSRVATLPDRDALVLRVVEFRGNGLNPPGHSGARLLYPALITRDMKSSLDFFVGILKLEIESQGEQPWPMKMASGPENSGSTARWTLLTAAAGTCLKLIQPGHVKVGPSPAWEMQRVGFTHFAFAAKDLDAFYEVLLKEGVHFHSSPQSATTGPHRGGKGVYMKTPDGFVVELIDSPLTRGQMEREG